MYKCVYLYGIALIHESVTMLFKASVQCAHICDVGDEVHFWRGKHVHQLVHGALKHARFITRSCVETLMTEDVILGLSL